MQSASSSPPVLFPLPLLFHPNCHLRYSSRWYSNASHWHSQHSHCQGTAPFTAASLTTEPQALSVSQVWASKALKIIPSRCSSDPRSQLKITLQIFSLELSPTTVTVITYLRLSSTISLFQTLGDKLPREVMNFLLWRYLKPTRMPSCVTYCRESTLAGSWIIWSLEVPSGPYNSIIPRISF